MKKLILVSILLMSVFFTAFAGGEGESLKIGVAGPHSGDLAAYGIPTLQAVGIIAEDINDAGGIDGRIIEVIEADDVCDPAQATTVASKLAADEVLAVVGHVCSGATISALPTYMNAGIPIVSPAATNPSLTAGEYVGFFRTIASDDKQGVTQGNFLVNTLGVSRVAVIHDQQDYGKGLADYTKATLESSGIEISIDEGIAVGAVDYSAVVSKIVSENVDAVVFGGYHPEGSKLITQLKERGYDGAFISGDGLKGEEFINLAGAASEGVYVTGAKDSSNTPEYMQALQEYQDGFGGDPGAFYFEGYAAMTVIVEAIRAGNTRPSDIQDYLYAGNKVKTSVGEIYFDENGDAVGTGFSVYRVANGAFVEQ